MDNDRPLSKLEINNYAKSYIFTKKPPKLFYIVTEYDPDLKETIIIPIELNIGNEEKYNLILSKLNLEHKTTFKPFQQEITTELKRSLMGIIIENNPLAIAKLNSIKISPH